jgi:hypothetical protein
MNGERKAMSWIVMGAFILFCAATCGAIGGILINQGLKELDTPAGQSQPVKQPGVKASQALPIYDDFSDPNSGWDTFTQDFGDGSYEDGEYSLCVKKAKWWVYDPCSWIEPLSNFTAEVDVRKLSEEAGGVGGLNFRYSQDKNMHNYYAFVVRPDNSSCKIIKCIHDKVYTVKEWLQLDYIKKGMESNRLKVICWGSQIEVYVNGNKVDKVEDTSEELMEGNIGLIAASPSQFHGSHFHFDNFKLDNFQPGETH